MPKPISSPPLTRPIYPCRLDDLVIQTAQTPGAEHRACPSTAELLLARHAELARGEPVLIWPALSGILGVWAAGVAGGANVILLDTNLPAIETARATLAANRTSGVRCEVALPEVGAGYRAVLMPLPKGRDLARLMLLAAAEALAPGGSLYLAGANKEGIKSIAGDAAELYGEGEVLAFKHSNRVVRFIRPAALPEPLPERYAKPGIARGTWHQFSAELAGEPVTLETRPGVFSWRELDDGTARLLEHMTVQPYDRALDLGCGYGVIGLWMAARVPRGSVTLVDSDLLAVESARRNLAAHGYTDVPVFLGDGLEGLPNQRYTLIVSNPPFHADHQVNSATAERWMRLAYEHLSPRGRLVIVANRFLPYQRVLEAVFGNFEVVHEDTRFRVLQAVKAYRSRAEREGVAEADEWDDSAENEAIRAALASLKDKTHRES
ncbi:MAG: class I SAM-dependent methyltransferase [Chloroflexi bacterium]|nr:class I SAM-dependent methyltransferase [Chloroflexota bacterium]